jgi:antitoxin HicB
MQYHFKIHKEKTGYWADCIELCGCQTQAGSRTGLRKNMHEALNLYLNEDVLSKLSFPLPKKQMHGRNIATVSVSHRVALATWLRFIRRKMGLTQKKMAKLLGMNGVFSYQRLESPGTANPEWETIVRIKKAIPEIPLDDLAA